MADGMQTLDKTHKLVYNDYMDRKQIISKSLEKINAKWRNLFEWLTCEDLGRDWEGIGNPYGRKDTKIVKNAGRDAESERGSS